MIETLIHYQSEYITDAAGRRVNFRYDRRAKEFERDAAGELIPDPGGRPYRQWRDHIRSPQDIWEEIVAAAGIPGTTSAPKLQPIETRLVMLQTGMRAAMGIKVRAPDLETLDRVAIQLEGLVREAPSVDPGTVNADRVIGKPYLEIEIDRKAIARYGMSVADVQEVIATAIGGKPSRRPWREESAIRCASAIRGSCGTIRTRSRACSSPGPTGPRCRWGRSRRSAIPGVRR
jgi:copper/silver efflux system protein